MADEATNPSGSDNVEPSTALDNPANLNFVELEDQANPEGEVEGTETEREPDDNQQVEEAEETEEAPETEQASESEPDEQAASETEPGDVLLTLKSGRQVKMADVESEMMMQADFTRKTTEVANDRRALESTAERVNATIEAFSKYLASQLPAEPPPALAYSDPTAFTQQKAVYDAALQQVNAIIEMGQQSTSAHAELTETDMASLMERENASLVEKMPALKDEAKRTEFNEKTLATAQHFGFSLDELNKTTDHRMLMLGHYARLGLEAEQAKATATLKAEKAPPATPANKRSKKADPGADNKAAMAKLRKSGSIHDAMKVDFD